jgi:hypothetical protein
LIGWPGRGFEVKLMRDFDMMMKVEIYLEMLVKTATEQKGMMTVMILQKKGSTSSWMREWPSPHRIPGFLLAEGEAVH